MKIEGCATSDGTARFAAKFRSAATGNFRQTQNLNASSIGIGTYLGNYDAATDEAYKNAVVRFVELGGNVIDTAANYRFQRSERSIGAALKVLAEKGFAREELIVCTKGGYLPFDGEPPRSQADFMRYFEETFVKTGIAAPEDVVGGSHCMTPRYLESQIEQSLRNMNLGSLDVFYIHNPESQLAEISLPEFEARIAAAFERLEEIRSDGKLSFYGAATWNGFRVSPQTEGYLSLERMVNIARQVAGDDHGFRFIQLPFNFAMLEAFTFQNQAAKGKAVSTIQAATDFGVTVVASASILQGKLARNLPPNFKEILGNLKNDAQTGIQFVRSTPGITTALVGMSQTAHVEENLELAKIAPTDVETYQQLFSHE